MIDLDSSEIYLILLSLIDFSLPFLVIENDYYFYLIDMWMFIFSVNNYKDKISCKYKILIVHKLFILDKN